MENNNNQNTNSGNVSPVSSNVVNKESKPKNLRSQLILIMLISTLGIAAALGTFFVINQFQQKESELSEADQTLAWYPKVTGSCTQGTIKLGPESAPFDVSLKLTRATDTQTLQFSSGANNKLDETFTWPFAVANGDTVNWEARVTWNNGNNIENHTGSVRINNCTQSTPTASPSSTSTVAPSSTVRPTSTATVRPTATATSTVRPTATATNAPTPTASTQSTPAPTATATPAPTQVSQSTTPPAPGGDGQSDGLGCSVNDCSGNKVADNKAVADAQASSTLPDAGVPAGVYLIIISTLFITSGVILAKNKKY